MDPVNLETMSTEEFQNFLNSFDVIVSDCDGVLWYEAPISGSGEFIELMKSLGKRCHFVSNNSTCSEVVYRKKFDMCQIKNGFENLMIPSLAIVEYLKSINFNKKVFTISCVETNKQLEKHGFHIKTGPHALGPEITFPQLAAYAKDDPEIGAVVMDSDFIVNMAKLWMAETYLKRIDVPLICGATDKNVPIGGGVLAMGVGYLSNIVAERSNKEPVTLAKPGRLYAEQVMNRFKITDPSRVLFIGDTVSQDMAFAKVAGFKSLFVLTSFPLEAALKDKSIGPDFYASTLGAALPNLKSVLI